MIKKVYTVSGFDCANCAAKAETFIAKQNNVEYAHMDFSSNRLYITFKNNPWTVDELAKVIKQVEDDPLYIAEGDSKTLNTQKIFTKKMWISLARIITSVIITLICIFALAKEDLSVLRLCLYGVAIIIVWYDILWKVILHIKNRTNILDHNLLISIAAIGAFTLAILSLKEDHIVSLGGLKVASDEAMEAVMVIVLFQIGQIIESVATSKSKNAVMSAVSLRVDKANLLTDEGVISVKPEELKIGDIVLITAGEQIPIDGVIESGEAFIDTSSLTGEYVPVRAISGTTVYSGCIVKTGSAHVKVTSAYEHSTINKILEMISSGGEQKSKADEFIAKFAKWYTPIVVIISLLTLLIGGLISKQWMTWVHTALEILVIGCPCAIVISVPLAYFSSIGLASKKGIVVKGANYLDKLANLGALVTDKTGTLTHGSFSIQKICPKDCDEDTLLLYLYVAECLSKHPIGKAICHGVDTRKLASEVKNFQETAGLGVACEYKGKKIVAGSERIISDNGMTPAIHNEAGSSVHLAIDGKYMGYVILCDEIKQDAQPMVDLLHNEKVKIVLLTGDHEENAKAICNELGIDKWYSELLPEDKIKYLEKEMNETNKSVAFIGDGINDAPSIIRSDVGIAMGGIGSDIAVENADLVIMNDDPAKVYDAIHIAKIARRTSLFNISFALAIKFIVFILAIIFKDVNWMMYVAVLADTGLTVLLVINSLLILYRKAKRPKLI